MHVCVDRASTRQLTSSRPDSPRSYELAARMNSNVTQSASPRHWSIEIPSSVRVRGGVREHRARAQSRWWEPAASREPHALSIRCVNRNATHTRVTHVRSNQL